MGLYHFKMYLCERLLSLIIIIVPKKDEGLILINHIEEYLLYVIRINKHNANNEKHASIKQYKDNCVDGVLKSPISCRIVGDLNKTGYFGNDVIIKQEDSLAINIKVREFINIMDLKAIKHILPIFKEFDTHTFHVKRNFCVLAKTNDQNLIKITYHLLPEDWEAKT